MKGIAINSATPATPTTHQKNISALVTIVFSLFCLYLYYSTQGRTCQGVLGKFFIIFFIYFSISELLGLQCGTNNARLDRGRACEEKDVRQLWTSLSSV